MLSLCHRMIHRPWPQRVDVFSASPIWLNICHGMPVLKLRHSTGHTPCQFGNSFFALSARRGTLGKDSLLHAYPPGAAVFGFTCAVQDCCRQSPWITVETLALWVSL